MAPLLGICKVFKEKIDLVEFFRSEIIFYLAM